MPRMNTLMLGLSLCVLPGFVAVIPVFAQDRIIQQTTIESKVSRPAAVRQIIEESTTYGIGKPDFERRIADLNNWIDLGMSKGWLDTDRAAAFKSEANRLSDFLAAHCLPNGQLSVSANNMLEKQLNILSADLSSTMSGAGSVAGLQQVQ